jgi:EmrB/QacA subfamily drug resistance transporter
LESTNPTSAPALTHRQILVIFSGLMLGMLLAALDQTIVATALPTITGELGGLEHLSWVVTAYLLAATVATPLYGKFGDLYGRKGLFQIAIVVFLTGSVLAGLAQNMAQLIAFRAIQGAGGGGLIVLAQAIIADVVSPRERGRYQGYFGAVFGVTSIAGPLLGGFFTDQLSWRWIFYVNLPLGMLALMVTAAVLPAGERRGGARIDYLGAAVLIAAVNCIVLFTTWGGTQYAWSSPLIISLVAASIFLLAVFVPIERRAPEPIVPISLFRLRTFNVAGGAGFIVGMAMFGAIAFLPLFLQVVQGASATNSGLLLLPLMAGLLTASIGSGQVITRTGRYRIFPIAGTAIAAVGMFLLSTMGAETSRLLVTLYMVMLGVGIGFTLQTLVLATQNAVPMRDLGAATSAVTFLRSMGGAIGVAIFGALFNNVLAGRLAGLPIGVEDISSITPAALARLSSSQAEQVVSAFADSLTAVFSRAAVVVVAAFAITWLLRETPLRLTTHASAGESAASQGMVEPEAAASAGLMTPGMSPAAEDTH